MPMQFKYSDDMMKMYLYDPMIRGSGGSGTDRILHQNERKHQTANRFTGHCF